MSYYIVYSYQPSYGYTPLSIYQERIYTTLEEAKSRQMDVYGENGRDEMKRFRCFHQCYSI